MELGYKVAATVVEHWERLEQPSSFILTATPTNWIPTLFLCRAPAESQEVCPHPLVVKPGEGGAPRCARVEGQLPRTTHLQEGVSLSKLH